MYLYTTLHYLCLKLFLGSHPRAIRLLEKKNPRAVCTLTVGVVPVGTMSDTVWLARWLEIGIDHGSDKGQAAPV